MSDASDFERVFDSVFPAAQAVARRLVGDPIVAEDIAAEAMARALARWDRLRRQPWREAWIVRVASNLALDYLRRHPVALAKPGHAEWEDTVALRVALVEALGRLPRRQREVVVLRCLADLPEVEVARSLHIAPRTVNQHLTRALAGLRQQLRTENVEEIRHALDT